MQLSKDNLIQFTAIAQLYFSLSLMFGTWVLYIPTITENLNMSEGLLGTSLLFSAIGALAGTFIGKYITPNFGEGKIAFYSMLAVVFATIFIFAAQSYYQVTLALFLFGISSGIYQVGTNSLVISIEKLESISIMSKCHAFFSLGAMLATGAGTALILLLNNPLLHITICSVIVIAFQFIFKKHYYYKQNTEQEHDPKSTGSKQHVGILTIISLIGICGLITEGAIADWSGLYLKDIVNAKEHLWGLGYAGFSMTMTIGRFSGDFFSQKFGALKLIIGGFFISIIGFIFILMATPNLTILVFIIVGFGFSIIVPEVYRLSANIKGIKPSDGIAFVAGASYIGFLAGPMALGFIAEKYDLSVSFTTLFGLIILGTVLTVALSLKSKCKMNNIATSNNIS